MKKIGFRASTWRSGVSTSSQNGSQAAAARAGVYGGHDLALSLIRSPSASSSSLAAARGHRTSSGLLASGKASLDHMSARVEMWLRPRDLLIHDGNALRRFHLTTRQQLTALIMFGALALAAVFGCAQMITRLPFAGPLLDPVVQMRAEVAQMRADMVALRKDAEAHAHRLEQRQAMLDALAAGKTPAAIPVAARAESEMAAAVVAPFESVEILQQARAQQMRIRLDGRYLAMSTRLAQAGFDPTAVRSRGVVAMGGPYEPVVTPGRSDADPEFRKLFQSWQRLDELQRGAVAIPSAQPVENMMLTSQFGVRSDPFRGGAAMHAGIDIPGPLGTSIYATADGIVGRAGWAGGYGNLVELNHGGGIQTRYGHLSALLVLPGQAVKKGQLIGRMGSTGRSTGSHLHYEVRLDGQAVNPMAFLQPGKSNYTLFAESEDLEALGGPTE